MARQTTISRAELDRIRSSVQDPVITDYEATRRARKQMSDDRQSRWPNTLEAQRRKKENWKVEKYEREEAVRVKIDQEEAALQRRNRIEAIKRANYILYEQTDKMKGLRSAQMYTDVIADREEQKLEKVIKAKWVDEAGGEYQAIMMKQLAEMKRKDEEKEAARKAANERNAELQKEQLADLRVRYLDRLQQEKREGELVIEKSNMEVVEDAEKAAERALQARMAAEEMALANQRLKKLQLEVGLKEAEEDRKRQAELRAKEEMAVAKKRLEGERFMAKQATRQRMIDRACEELAKKANQDQKVAEKQAAEARAKEDADLAQREAKRQWQRDAIAESMRQQVAGKRALDAQEEKEAAERLERSRLKYERMEREEVEKVLAARKRAADCRGAVEAQIADKARWGEEEREQALRGDAQTKAVLAEDDARFRRIAAGVYEEAKAAGLNTIPIEKAMFAKSITLLPASTSMRV